MKVIWLASAMKHLEETLLYISSDNPVAAERYVDDIFERATKMLEFPDIGSVYSIQGRKIIRKLVLDKNKFILYRSNGNDILVLDLQDSRMNWKQ